MIGAALLEMWEGRHFAALEPRFVTRPGYALKYYLKDYMRCRPFLPEKHHLSSRTSRSGQRCAYDRTGATHLQNVVQAIAEQKPRENEFPLSLNTIFSESKEPHSRRLAGTTRFLLRALAQGSASQVLYLRFFAESLREGRSGLGPVYETETVPSAWLRSSSSPRTHLLTASAFPLSSACMS